MQLKYVIVSLVLSDTLIFRLIGATIEQMDFTPIFDHSLWNIIEGINKHCFNPVTSLIILPDDSYDEEKKFLTSLYTDEIPSYIFGKDGNETLQKHQHFRQISKLELFDVSQKTYPAGSVTIFVPQNIDFLKLLENLKSSIWWNSRAKFLLVNVHSHGCTIAYNVLALMWSFNVLSAIYFCWNQENQLAVYTFNPYSHSAPKFWTPVVAMTDMNKEWTLLQHTFQQVDGFFPTIDSALCRSFYFDKLHNMYGYNLKLLHSETDRLLNEDGIGYDICKAAVCKVVCNVLKAMNATFTLKRFTTKGIKVSNVKLLGIAQEVVSGALDLSLFDIFLRDYWWLQSYPYSTNKIKIVTSLQRNYTFKFFYIFKPASWLFFALLCVFTVLSLKYILKKNPSMEFVRVFVNQATLNVPKHKFGWVCFISLLYMWFIINVSIQSHFRADKIAIKQDSIDSVEDLMKSELTIYGFISLKEFISVKNRFIGENSHEVCLQYPSSDKSTACLISDDTLKMYLPANAEVHISKNNVIERATAWFFSEDSPLLSNFNNIVSRLNEAGIPNFFSELDDMGFQRNILRDIPKVDLTDLIIAVHILFWGWMLALAIFISEITVRIISNNIKIFR